MGARPLCPAQDTSLEGPSSGGRRAGLGRCYYAPPAAGPQASSPVFPPSFHSDRKPARRPATGLAVFSPRFLFPLFGEAEVEWHYSLGSHAMLLPEEREPAPRRLDEIPTQWSLLDLAHRPSLATSSDARNVLVLRYARAIRNYVGALVRDEQEADELSQEVVMRLLKGQFATANPDKGSFRRML